MNGFFYPWWFWGCTLGLLGWYSLVFFKDTRNKKPERKDDVEEFSVTDDEEEAPSVVSELPGGEFSLSGGHYDDDDLEEIVDEYSEEEQVNEDAYDDTGDALEETPSEASDEEPEPAADGDSPYDEAMAIQNSQMTPVRDERRWEQMFGSMDMFAELAAPLSRKTQCQRTLITQ